MTSLTTEVVAARGRGEIGAANVNKAEGKDLATPGSLLENRDEGKQKGRTEKESFEWNFRLVSQHESMYEYASLLKSYPK